MKKKTYISGKISGLPKDEYTKLFNEAVLFVMRRGESYVCPIYLKPFLGIRTWFCHMITDVVELIKCNKVLMLGNWKDSIGSMIEHFVAKLMRIEIEYYKPNK